MCVHACMRERRDERRDNSTKQRPKERPAQRKGITHRMWVPQKLGASPGGSICSISQNKHPEHRDRCWDQSVDI